MSNDSNPDSNRTIQRPFCFCFCFFMSNDSNPDSNRTIQRPFCFCFLISNDSNPDSNRTIQRPFDFDSVSVQFCPNPDSNRTIERPFCSPSNDVFDDIYRSISTGKDNIDGADQGFLTSYFTDLLDKPLFHPPPTTNSTTTTRLHGQYRLPLGYQMDASYYYIRLKWRVLCGPHSVITFPGASWLKPWYWWSWPVLPLGISWHSERLRTIGYTFEFRILFAESFVYCSILVLTLAASLGFISFGMKDRLHRSCVRQDSAAGYILRPICVIFSFLLPMWAIPTTSHPFAGWAVSLLGAISMLTAFAVALQLQVTLVVAPWLLICTSLVVMAFPWYSNGIVRMLCIFGYAALSTPLLWWSLKSAAGAGSNQSAKGQSKRSISD